MPLIRLAPAPDYPAVIRACGGWGLRVEEPNELPDALVRALAEVRNGRQALLSVACA